jgi:hypothetical protein|nr:MAG TPA: Protein of unknown function (DUF2612) [Caudoviricetes sp.]
MTRFLEEYEKNLPDYYRKSPESNNFKILSVEKHTITDFKQDMEKIFQSLNLDTASGKTLDLYGETVNQPRGLATDAQYIMMIRSKIMRNISSGDYPSVVRAICRTFDCEASQVFIQEKDTPCTVELVVLPISVINKAGLTTRQTVQLIKQILPVGVSIESVVFEGTFCFSDRLDEYDAAAGFRDDSLGIEGGHFGIVYGEDDEKLLPIE